MFNVLWIALIALSANGQEVRPLQFQSLDQLLSQAMGHNLTIRAQKSRVEVQDSLATS